MWEVQVQPVMDEGSPVLSICEERLRPRVAESFGQWVLALHSAKGQIIRKSSTAYSGLPSLLMLYLSYFESQKKKTAKNPSQYFSTLINS